MFLIRHDTYLLKDKIRLSYFILFVSALAGPGLGWQPRQHLSICNILDLGLCNTDHHQEAEYDIRVWDNPQTTVGQIFHFPFSVFLYIAAMRDENRSGVMIMMI